MNDILKAAQKRSNFHARQLITMSTRFLSNGVAHIVGFFLPYMDHFALVVTYIDYVIKIKKTKLRNNKFTQ